MRKMRMPLAFLLTIVVLGGCGRAEPPVIPYNPDFLEILERGDVASVQIISRPTGSWTLLVTTQPGVEPEQFSVEVDASQRGQLMGLLVGAAVEFSAETAAPDTPNVTAALVIGLFLALWIGLSLFVLWLLLRLVRAAETIARNTRPPES